MWEIKYIIHNNPLQIKWRSRGLSNIYPRYVITIPIRSMLFSLTQLKQNVKSNQIILCRDGLGLLNGGWEFQILATSGFSARSLPINCRFVFKAKGGKDYLCQRWHHFIKREEKHKNFNRIYLALSATEFSDISFKGIVVIQ